MIQTDMQIAVYGLLTVVVSTVSSELCGQYYDLQGNFKTDLNCTQHISGPYCCGEQYNRTCCPNQRKSIYWPSNKLHSIDQTTNVSAAAVFFITFFILVLVFTMSITCCCFYCCQDDQPRYSIHANDIDTESDDNIINMDVGLDWDDSAHSSIKSFVDDEDIDKENSDNNEDNATETDPLNRQTPNSEHLSNSVNGTSEFKDKC